MDQMLRRKQSFLLRLPPTLREQARLIAQDEGVSLNHFIGLALAEKLTRIEVQRRDETYPQRLVRPTRPPQIPFGSLRPAAGISALRKP